MKFSQLLKMGLRILLTILNGVRKFPVIQKILPPLYTPSKMKPPKFYNIFVSFGELCNIVLPFGELENVTG